MASDIIARGMAVKAAGDLSQFKEETTEALAGKADLQDGKVPASQLPSYVDDVVEYASVEAFPATGELGKIYVAMDTGYTYRWAGSDYIQIGGQDLSDIVTSFAQDYDSTATYAVGDFCTHENVFYVCSTDIDQPEAWNAAHWTRTTVAAVIAARDAQIAALQQAASNLRADFADEYDSSLSYKTGALVIHDYKLYKAKSAISPEAWDVSHWEEVDFYQALRGKYVHIIDAGDIPSTIDSDFFQNFQGGFFVNGTYLGLVNPIFFPVGALNPTHQRNFGLCVGHVNEGYSASLRWYVYGVKLNSNVVLNSEIMQMGGEWYDHTGYINILKRFGIRGKGFPDYPSDVTKTYVLTQTAAQDGPLAWVEQINNLAPEYDATATYAVGDVVMHDGRLYECTTAIAVAEAWDASHWDAVTVGEELAGKVDISQATDVTISDERVQGAPNLGSITVDGDPYNIPQKTSDLMNDSGFMTSPMTEITWAALKELRDNGNLVPGMQYRITDYTCTTTTALTHSAGHVFDIIVVADNETTLNKKARAVQHEGDTYFANNDLAAWQLWYDLDNDQTKYAWADPVNGKGVIFRMIDEFNNDVPYDFKNIVYEALQGFNASSAGRDYLFVRDSSLDENGYYGWRTNAVPIAWSNPYCFTNTETLNLSSQLYANTSGTPVSGPAMTITSINNTSYQRYTFRRDSGYDDPDNHDGSLDGWSWGNVIKSYKQSNNIQTLNHILFQDDSYANIFEHDCRDLQFYSAYKSFFGSKARKSNFAYIVNNSVFGPDLNVCDFSSSVENSNFGATVENNKFTDSISRSRIESRVNSNTFKRLDSTYVGFGISVSHFPHMTHCIVDIGVYGYNYLNDDIGIGEYVNVHIHAGNYTNITALSTAQTGNTSYATDIYAAGSQEIILGGSN